MSIGKLPAWAAVLFLSGATLAYGQATTPSAAPTGAPLQIHPGWIVPTPAPAPAPNSQTAAAAPATPTTPAPAATPQGSGATAGTTSH